MKMHFNFDLTAEGGKFVGNELSGEIGQFACPINVDLELEPAEIQQSIGLVRDLAKEIPNLMKQKHENELELAERRAKLEADNLSLRAVLAKSAAQKPAQKQPQTPAQEPAQEPAQK